MEELNKTQIVLLTLLVSFVTSIATGIVTVTLLEQAPPAVTQTINRVVEKTVERVVPGETKIVERIREVETSKTEDDLIIATVEKASATLVNIIKETQGEDGDPLIDTQTGFFVSTEGLIVTAAADLEDNKSYGVSWKGTEKRTAIVIRTDRTNNIALLKINPVKDSVKKDVVSYVKVSTGQPVLGQMVLALGSHDIGNPTVSSGIIAGVRQESASTTPRIQTTIDVNRGNIGGPLLNLHGDLIGLLIGSEGDIGKGIAAPVNLVAKLIATLSGDISVEDSDSVLNTAASSQIIDKLKLNQ